MVGFWALGTGSELCLDTFLVSFFVGLVWALSRTCGHTTLKPFLVLSFNVIKKQKQTWSVTFNFSS